MFDLVVRSDRVVTPAGVQARDVAIRGEKIAALEPAGTIDAQATRRLMHPTSHFVMVAGRVAGIDFSLESTRGFTPAGYAESSTFNRVVPIPKRA